MSDEIQMIYSDNPYIDVLVYNTKILAKGCVVKNQNTADSYETAETMKRADIYCSCIEQHTFFEMFFPYPRWAINMIDPDVDHQVSYMQDNYNIPEELRPRIQKYMMDYTIQNYEEGNEYYRELNGQPPILGDFIYPGPYIPDDIYVTDKTLPIHEFSDFDIDVLEVFGILDKIKADYPDAKYLNHLGYKRIDIYKARKALEFELLYIPGCEVEEIRSQYIETYARNRDFTLKTIYSDAFRFQSDYYDNFISLFITIQTMIDIITNVQINILKKDVFDSRTLRWLFESYGIPYYSEIPLKYQVAMIKNIHTLLKYKSTNRNIVDICSLFGYDNIVIFKYYLLKDRTVSEDDITGYDKEASELKFIKLPLQDKIDYYIKDRTNYLTYDQIVYQDEFWDGDLPHDEIKKRVMDKEFALVRTKYLSVDSMCDLSDIAFNICYFFNFIFDKHKLEEYLVCYVPYIKQNKAFRMVDLFIFLTCINFYYMDVEDTIMDTMGKVLYIKGFNFEADLAGLAQYLADNHVSDIFANIAGFHVEASSILTYKQMLKIFVDNKDVYKYLVNEMVNCKDMRMYRIFKKIYDSLMIIEYTNKYFEIPTGGIAKTYTEFLKYRDPTLYAELKKLAAITDLEKRRNLIVNLIDHVIYALDECFNNDEILRYIYRYFPGHGEELIQQYIMKMIMFFKSYKTQLLNLTIIYLLDDRLENNMRPIDHLQDLISHFDLDEGKPITEKVFIDIWFFLNEKDMAGFLDKMRIEVSRLVDKSYIDKMKYYDTIDEFYLHFIFDDWNKYKDMFMDLIATHFFSHKYTIDSRLHEMNSTLTYEDRLYRPLDKVSIEPYFE